MDIKETLSKIRQELGEENSSKISGLLNSIEYSYNDLSNARNSIDDARVKYRDRAAELEKEVEGLQTKINTLSNDDTVKKLAEENEQLKGFQRTVFKQNREIFKAKHEKIKELPAFEKVKGKFEIPMNGEEYDYEKLDDTAINNMLSKINEYEEVGLFEKTDIKPEDPLKPKHLSGGNKDGLYNINGKDYTLTEVADKFPGEYAKIRTSIMDKEFVK